MYPTIIKEGQSDGKDENKLPLLNENLRMTNGKGNNLINELNQVNDKEDSTTEKFPTTDDPTDEQVINNCSDIVVNDITIPVDIPRESNTQLTLPKPVVEIKYDNVELTGKTGQSDLPVDQDRLKRLMTNMEVKEEVNVIKSDDISKPITDVSIPVPRPIKEPINPSFALNSLYPNMNTNRTTNNDGKVILTNDIVKPLQIIKEDKPTLSEPKSPRKDMVIVKNEDDIDETSSLANFFDDMKKIVEEKGIKVETNIDKSYSLFEDAAIVENKF